MPDGPPDFIRRKAVARLALLAVGASMLAFLAWPFAATVRRVVPPTPPADRP